MYREKRRNKIIILVLIGIICLIGIGYAAFSSKLNITGTSNITSTWDVRITNIESELHGAEDIEEPSYDNTNGLYASFSTGLKRPGDYALYTVTIENRGSVDARIEKINTYYKENKYITFTLSGLSKGDVIKGKETKELQVKVEFNSDVTSIEENISVDLDISIDVAQDSDNPLPANDYYVTYDYSTNGGESSNAINDYVAEGSNVNLEYTATKTGYEFMGWNTDKGATVGLESYSMPSNNVTLYAIFRKIDTTPPVISNVSTSSTTSSITIVTTAIEEDGEIVKYEYKIDNEEYVTGDSNTYTFTGLTQNTNHKIKVRVTNRDNLQVESEEYSVNTKELNVPTFSEVETDNGKTVTISYPEGEGLTYEYQKDGSTWQSATQNQEVEFTESGTLVAKVSDGTNEESSSYSVEIKPNAKNTITELAKLYPSELYTDDYGNIRYYGANPSNYVTFNNELWQIMGVIDGKVKIVRSENIPIITTDNGLTIASNAGFYWNHVQQDNKEFNNWETSTLHMYLNGTYYNSIESNSKDMIAEETYYLGGPTSNNYYEATAKDYYTFERSNSVLSDNPVSIRQNIGLIYPSDYGYASAKDCHFLSLSSYRKEVGSYSDNDCAASNYLYNEEFQWLQTPGASEGIRAAYISSVGQVLIYGFNTVKSGEHQVFPSLYLKAKVQIAGGSGTSSDPYRLTF